MRGVMPWLWTPPGRYGFKYFIMCREIDVRYGVVEVVNNKSGFCYGGAFCQAHGEHAPGKKPKIIRSDNGTELVNNLTLSFMGAWGIRDRQTTPHTSESNGMAILHVEPLQHRGDHGLRVKLQSPRLAVPCDMHADKA
eukprot:147700-Chlamydomonas_euryale.AAC.1